MTNKTFKKIIALAMAIALVVCFAVSTSAMEVATTTKYVDGQANVEVTVNVTDAAEGYVTYYAKNGSTPVYVDQASVGNDGAASFKFKTAAANINSTVIMGNTGDTIREDVIPTPAPTGTFGAVCFGYGATDTTLTVLGKVTGAEEYGIIVSDSAITAGSGLTYAELAAKGNVYQAVDCNSLGGFAVQIVEAGGNFIDANASYNVAVYAKNNSGYTVVLPR